MYSFFVSFLLFSRRLPRPIRVVLVVFAIGILVFGLIYASIIFRTLNERSRSPHVHTSRFYRSSPGTKASYPR
jgi:RsiW-degrading membrane proteinase PrsW (M82 family)